VTIFIYDHKFFAPTLRMSLLLVTKLEQCPNARRCKRIAHIERVRRTPVRDAHSVNVPQDQ
jgi:hypothetical protein